MLHTQENVSKSETRKELVISNPRVEDIRTFYSVFLFLLKLKQNRNDVLSTKIELNDLLNMDEEMITLITQSTDLSKEQIRNLMKHFSADVKNLLNCSAIPNF